MVLLLALLLAFSIWLIHNLSLSYNDNFSVVIIAESNIAKHASESSNKCEVSARCNAKGYQLLGVLFGNGDARKVKFQSSDLTHFEDDIYYITSSRLQEYSDQIFGSGVKVDSYLTDTLFFRFPEVKHAKVPVIPISSITYKEQYMAAGKITVQPDSVIIYGEPYVLENVKQVYTQPITHSNVSEDIRGVVNLEKINGVRFSTDNIQYSLSVKRYVELVINLPIKTKNVPHDKFLRVYPSEAKVRIRCEFPLREDPERGLGLEVDYRSFIQSRSGKAILQLSGLTSNIISYDIDPFTVSGFLEDKRR